MDKTLFMVKRDENYLDELFNMVKDSGKKVCYVSFNKTPDFILEFAKKKKISPEKFYFVDCITSRIKSSPKIKNIIQIDDFDNIEKIMRIVKKIADEGHSLVIFDSLSNILIYPSMKDSKISKYTGDLFDYLDDIKGQAIIICYEKDIGNYSLEKTLALFNHFIRPLELIGEM